MTLTYRYANCSDFSHFSDFQLPFTPRPYSREAAIQAPAPIVLELYYWGGDSFNDDIMQLRQGYMLAV